MNKAVTLHELKHSPGCNFTFFACSTKLFVLWIWWWGLPTKGLRILVSSVATPSVTDLLLDTIGLRGMSVLWILGSP